MAVGLSGGGQLWRVPPGPGTPEVVVDSLTDFTLRDVETGPNGNLWLSGWPGSGGPIRVYSPGGTLVKTMPAPGKVSGLHFGPSGALYANVGHTSQPAASAGLYMWDGASWTPLVTNISGIGNPEAFTAPAP